MKQQYFIVVLAHSVHGRLRRIHIPHQVVYAVLLLAVLGLFSLAGFLSSYVRMAWKVANYNALRDEVASLRSRYQNLQKTVSQTNQDLATMQMFAGELSLAFGLKRSLEGPDEIGREGRLVPTIHESFQEYNFLKGASLSRFHRRFPSRWHNNVRPTVWPVEGHLASYFGRREDPFTDGYAFHPGVDISAPTGTPVRAAADGVVVMAEWGGAYGRLIILDHGNGITTYYAHLSRFDVIAGQEVRRAQLIGAVGGTGRVTSPHLHYEVRKGGSPVNAYQYLKDGVSLTAKRDLPF